MTNQSLAFTYTYSNATNDPVEERFQLNFSPVRRPLLPWKDEVYNTVKTIAANSTKPLYVAMSGGIDSEIIAKALLENSIPFSAITLEYADKLNSHDIQYAKDFCKEHSIHQEIVTVDPHYLYTTKMEEYINQGYHARNLYRYLQLFIVETVENLNGTVILGAETQAYYLLDNKLHIRYSTEIVNTIDWCNNRNTDHCINFFLHNPELYASYLLLPSVASVLNSPEQCHNDVRQDQLKNVPSGSSPEKELAYRSVWPDLIKRPKYNGFENLRNLRNITQNILRARFLDVGYVYIPVETIKTQLGI
jgi:hypothetical protein